MRFAGTRAGRLVAVAVLMLVVASCAASTATEIVVRIDTDIPRREILAIKFEMRDQVGGRVRHQVRYAFDERAWPLPGEIGVIGDRNDSAAVIIDVTAELRGDPPIRTRAIVSFQPRRIIGVDLYLFHRCRDLSAQAACADTEVCSAMGCASVFVPVREVALDAAVGSDATTDAYDVAFDRPIVPLDVPLDVIVAADVLLDVPADLPDNACTPACSTHAFSYWQR